jgi:peptidoglycan/LPS O-acetylase OafA/YrhL
MVLGDGRLRGCAWLAFGGYLLLYGCNEVGRPIAGLCFIQQTLVSVVFAGLISATLAGFRGVLGKILDHPVIQHVGRISFGLYLFHAPMPLLLGWILPWLWHPFFSGPWLMLRILVFGLASWGAAFGCHRYLEHRSFREKSG